jgi:Na+/melibiose symporter-like transporter
MTEVRVTRDDIEAKLRAIQSDVVERVESKRSTVLTGVSIAAVIMLILVYLLGRRAGKRKTTIVEIRRV